MKHESIEVFHEQRAPLLTSHDAWTRWSLSINSGSVHLLAASIVTTIIAFSFDFECFMLVFLGPVSLTALLDLDPFELTLSG